MRTATYTAFLFAACAVACAPISSGLGDAGSTGDTDAGQCIDNQKPCTSSASCCDTVAEAVCQSTPTSKDAVCCVPDGNVIDTGIVGDCCSLNGTDVNGACKPIGGATTGTTTTTTGTSHSSGTTGRTSSGAGAGTVGGLIGGNGNGNGVGGLLGGNGGGSVGGLLGGSGGSLGGIGGTSGGCTPNGQQSVFDGFDCCSGVYNEFNNDCIACTANGQMSVNEDGSDCCSEIEDPSGTCVACTPTGDPSVFGDGTDCCSQIADPNDTCVTCTPNGDPSVIGNGRDCCSGQMDSAGDCTPAASATTTGTSTSSGSVSTTSGVSSTGGTTTGGSTTGGSTGATVTTLAGSATEGYADGTGSTAEFAVPNGIAIDGMGNLYVADTNNSRIRIVADGGNTATLAGNGIQGSVNGDGGATGTAEFKEPNGVAVDGSGNVYIADTDNSLIRKVDGSGNVTTFAGSGEPGFADGSATAAQFFLPFGVAVDGSGNLYVADDFNQRIRKVDPTGNVTTLAGDGTAGFADGTGMAAEFDEPVGLAVDGSGNIYVADLGNERIRKIDPSGNVTTLAGSGMSGNANGAGTAAQFNDPAGVAVDAAGNIYVADSGNNIVRKIDPMGNVTTLAGSGMLGFLDGAATSAEFDVPSGVAVDGNGNVFVADTRNNRIRQISP